MNKRQLLMILISIIIFILINFGILIWIIQKQYDCIIYYDQQRTELEQSMIRIKNENINLSESYSEICKTLTEYEHLNLQLQQQYDELTTSYNDLLEEESLEIE